MNAQVKFLDFGLVFFEQVTRETVKAELTCERQLVGPQADFSLEQCAGRVETRHSDIYHLGLVAFGMILCRLAFESCSLQKLLMKQIKEKLLCLGPLKMEVSRRGIRPSIALQ